MGWFPYPAHDRHNSLCGATIPCFAMCGRSSRRAADRCIPARCFSPAAGGTVRSLAVALVAFSSVTVVIGQKENDRFQTASITRSASDGELPICSVVVDRVACLNQPMVDYIAIAQGVRPYLIVDSPEWVTRERFDVDGKLPRGGR